MKKNTKKRANHGEGCLVLRGKKYYARWVVNGKVFTRATGTGEKREAEKRLAEYVAPFRLGDEKSTLEGLAAKVKGVSAEIKAFEDSKPALALADGFTAYRASTHRPDTGARTLDDYEIQYTKFVDWVQEHYPEAAEMRHVSAEMAEQFAGHLAKTLSANSHNKYITLLRRMWEVLAVTAKLDSNPWKGIAKRHVASVTKRELTVDELSRVVGSAEGEMRILFALGIYTGLRLGDCAMMEWGSIDLVRGRIVTIPRKTARHANGKPVVIPFHGVLAGILAEIPPENRTGYLLPETAAQYLRNPSVLTNRIQRIFERCGIVTNEKREGESKASVLVGFHSLRHTFVSLSANAGVPLAVIQSIVGHSNPAMTRHYYHESEAALQSAVAALPAIGTDGTQVAVGDSTIPAHVLAVLDGLSKAQLEALQGEIAKRL